MDLANRLLIMPHYLSCLISYFFFFYGVLLAVVGLFARELVAQVFLNWHILIVIFFQFLLQMFLNQSSQEQLLMTLARDIALLAFGMLPSIVPTSNFQEGLLVFVISGFFMVGILDSEVVKSCGTFEQLLEMFGR
ncbi:MAG: hypothetical protein DWQ53_23845 [Microcystis flos-aquae DF17]|jgi:hypothetical protein|uniref:Uncharacterized protein n=2 Tax=Microcystis TaxID=1125 RepID=A0A5A5RH35_MICAE|nr:MULTISPECIES: hypothetical protein [Microcystis]REJ39022.1 MAG: hypothetical protein DWQ53_23845 [Microcystis flos-aquae DF17]AVQ73943.1 hypothetical protein B5D77_24025 [Microcystis sp. MC19]MDB9506428.1 hypothetical protein [Microcystis aeruginosa CS-338/01]GCA72457.1 hypothetical protein MiYa_04010 [Microcystis aeruginosa NIES-2519]GCA86511.1 hypothetical protein MiHa_04505 [Microcystis aeruginosa NIES-2522]